MSNLILNYHQQSFRNKNLLNNMPKSQNNSTRYSQRAVLIERRHRNPSKKNFLRPNQIEK